MLLILFTGLCFRFPTSKKGFRVWSHNVKGWRCPSCVGKLSPMGICMAWKGEGRVWQKTDPPFIRRYGMQGTGWGSKRSWWMEASGREWDETGVGAVSRVHLFPLPLLALPWCLASMSWWGVGTSDSRTVGEKGAKGTRAAGPGG